MNNANKKQKRNLNNTYSFIGFLTFLLLFLLPSCSSKRKLKKHYPDQELFREPSLQSLRNTHNSDTPFHEQNAGHRASIMLDAQAMLEYEARYPDIPMPLNATSCEQAMHENDQVLYYSYRSDEIDSLLAWYEQEMEMAGWIEQARIDSDEIMLLFDKPQRFCVIHITRPLKKSAHQQLKVSVYSGKKRI